MRAARGTRSPRSGKHHSLSYIGWGKTRSLEWPGPGDGAKLAKPEKLCINVMGDAAIGFTAWISRRRPGSESHLDHRAQ